MNSEYRWNSLNNKTMTKQFKKNVAEAVNKMWKSKDPVMQCITRYHKNISYYETEQEKIDSFFSDLYLEMFYNDFSDEFDEGLYLKIEAKIYIHRDDLKKFFDNVEFYCWERELDHKAFGKEEYYKFKLVRWYYDIAGKTLFYM